MLSILITLIIVSPIIYYSVKYYQRHYQDVVLDNHGTNYGLRRRFLESNSIYRQRILMRILGR